MTTISTKIKIERKASKSISPLARFTLPLLLAIIVSLSGCMKEGTLPISEIDLYGSRGVFIVNEGNYLYGNSSLSYYDIDSKQVINNIYTTANGIPLGDVAFTMTLNKGKGYIVMNNSSCIHVVDANSLLHIGTIKNLTSPRHVLFLEDELALVSDLYARAITLVNPETMRTTGTIETGTKSLPFYQHPTEYLIKVRNEIFANAWSYDNKILVIDSQSLLVTDSIEVGLQPLAMVKDKNDNIWVINDGGYGSSAIGNEPPSIMQINSKTHSVTLRINFEHTTDRAGQIATNPAADTLYFICNHLYAMHINDTQLPDEPILARNNNTFRALGVDPKTGEIYLSDAGDYMSEGKVYRLKPNGTPIDTLDVGIIPGNFCFN